MGIQEEQGRGNGNTGETEKREWEYRGNREEGMVIQEEQRGGNRNKRGTEREGM
jgi:hypothetical protein